MRVLVDVNVVLDVLLNREPWRADASAVWDGVATGKIAGYLAPTTITTIYYLARKQPTGSAAALVAVAACMRTFEICVLDRTTFDMALQLAGPDFEDNVQIACAQQAGVDGIVTRDQQHFKAAGCRVLSPADLRAEVGI